MIIVAVLCVPKHTRWYLCISLNLLISCFLLVRTSRRFSNDGDRPPYLVGRDCGSVGVLVQLLGTVCGETWGAFAVKHALFVDFRLVILGWGTETGSYSSSALGDGVAVGCQEAGTIREYVLEWEFSSNEGDKVDL